MNTWIGMAMLAREYNDIRRKKMTRLVLRNPSSLFGGDLLSDLNLSNFFADPVTDLRRSRYAKETISETDSHITLELELPGYEKSEITIDYKDNILCIEAKKENDTSKKRI